MTRPKRVRVFRWIFMSPPLWKMNAFYAGQQMVRQVIDELFKSSTAWTLANRTQQKVRRCGYQRWISVISKQLDFNEGWNDLLQQDRQTSWNLFLYSQSLLDSRPGNTKTTEMNRVIVKTGVQAISIWETFRRILENDIKTLSNFTQIKSLMGSRKEEISKYYPPLVVMKTSGNKGNNENAKRWTAVSTMNCSDIIFSWSQNYQLQYQADFLQTLDYLMWTTDNNTSIC